MTNTKKGSPNLAVVMMACAFAIVTPSIPVFCRTSVAAASTANVNDVNRTPDTNDSVPAGSVPEPRKVYVGVYAFQVPELSLVDNSYLVDFWVWFRWQGREPDPSQTFELLNLYEGWDVLKEAIYVDDDGSPAPDPLGDDWYYQVYRIQARFGRIFDVTDYPFDRQELVIAFEDSDQIVEDMVYVADADTTKIDPAFEIPGWLIRNVTAQVFVRAYPTNWGDPRRPLGADRYTQFRYSIHIERPVLGYLATTMVPIALVVMIVLMAFPIDPKYFEGRLGVIVTALIAAVALQLTASGDLPKTGYLVLLDHVYNLSYLVIFLALLESVVSVRLHDGGRPEAARRLDRWGLAFSSILFFGTTLILVLTRVT